MISVEQHERVTVIALDRHEARNAVDGPTALALAQSFIAFDENPDSDVAVFYGKHSTFCAGADLKALASGDSERANPLSADGIGPMGPSRMQLSKPVIGAISGHAVAGGLELALWCDIRVVEETTVMGVFCRRWGVPLVDGGTVRLPRLIGHSRAMDLILTGRPVKAEEALMMGLANRVVPEGQALSQAIMLAQQLCRFPQTCMRSDRLSACEQWGLDLTAAMESEFKRGMEVIESLETVEGATRFASGKGRHGQFDDI